MTDGDATHAQRKGEEGDEVGKGAALKRRSGSAVFNSISKVTVVALFIIEMSAEDIDLDYLISLVQERPPLWDKSNEDFSNKYRKANEWAAVCKHLFPEYDDFDNTKKNKIGNDIVKKWRSIKDNFFRYAKKIKENSASGSAAKTIKKYHYYNQLQFLMKVAQNKTENSLQQETENIITTPPTAPQSPLATTAPTAPGPTRYVPTTASRKRPHSEMDDFETATLKALQEKENRHLSFFKGILPSLNNFTELQTLTFQSKVIQIITEMRFGQQTQFSSPTPSTSYGYQTTEYQGLNYSSNSSRNDISTYRTEEYTGNNSPNASCNDSNSQEEQFDFNDI